MIDIQTLRAAGLTDQQIIAVVEADQIRAIEATAARREANRIRQRNHRARNASSRVTSVTSCDTCDSPPPSPSFSPDPLLLSPTPPCNNPLTPNSIPTAPPKETREAALFAVDQFDGFDEFYQAWPHKVGKQADRKAWPKAIKAIGSLVAMLDAVDRYIQQKPPDRAFMNPATFLNGQRWQDQPATTNGHHNGQLQKDGQPTIATVIRAHQEQLRRELSAEEGTDGDDISPSFDHVGWLPSR